MKLLLKILAGLVLLVGVCAGGFVSFIELRGIPKYDAPTIPEFKVESTPERVAVGAKIAGVQCKVCHTGAGGKLTGKFISDLPPDFGHINSANITHSKEHGIGNMSDAEIAYFLRTGLHKNGQYVPLYMPKYPHLSDEDLRCVIAWLRSDDPMLVADETPTIPTDPSFLTKFLCFVAFKPIPYPTAIIPQPDTTNLVVYGKYLVEGRYDCWTCHSMDFKTLNFAEPSKTPGYCQGDNMMLNLEGHKIYTANITQDEKTGLGTWNEDDFRRAMHDVKSKNGKTLRYPMLPYNSLTDAEVSAIWQYLRSIPKISNEVDRQWDKDI